MPAGSGHCRPSGRSGTAIYVFAALTFVLGSAFLSIEISEFSGMVAKGAGPTRSAFLSAFFTLVGMHGAHVTSGLLWLAYMVAQVVLRACARTCCGGCCASACSGMRSISIWVGVITLVYLMGAR